MNIHAITGRLGWSISDVMQLSPEQMQFVRGLKLSGDAPKNLAFITPDPEQPGAWLQSLGLDEFKAEDKSPLSFRKELIYEGDFTLQDHNGKRFSRRVDRAMLEHWSKTGNAFIANGNEIPLPVGHTRDPAAKKGRVLKLAIETNSRGQAALFAHGEFFTADAARTYSKSHVSMWVDEKYTDGARNDYVSPIRHVAITDYPIIPKLDRFEAMTTIAASLLSPPDPKESKTMLTIRELAKKAGVKLTDEEKDEVIADKLAKHIEESGTRLSEFEKAKIKADKEAAKAAEKAAAEAAKEGGEKQPPKKIAAGLLTILRDNRTMKLDKLVSEGRVTPAVKDDLAKQFCSDDALSLSLADDGSPAADGFDNLLAALSKNEPVISFKQKTGPQTLGELQLSDAEKKGGEESVLVKMAAKRAEAAKA